MSTTKIVFVGGGTGGHFYPLIAIAESIRERSAQNNQAAPQLYYMGPDTYDKQALQDTMITFVHCPAGKYRRYGSLLNVIDVFKSLFGVAVALVKLFWIYPDVIMSKGGYTSVPVTLAGWLLRIPIIIHESDSVAGSANKLAAHFAKSIAVSYPGLTDIFPKRETVLTGIPIRKVLLTPKGEGADQIFSIDQNIPTLLVIGGSQGAERINTLIIDSLNELLPHYNIIHQTGPGDFQNVVATSNELFAGSDLLTHYHPVPFLDAATLNQAYHVASLIISRAGSNSIYEIALHGKPSILIPIPTGISHDQRTNAYTYARNGATSVMEEENLEDGLLEAEISRIMNDQQLYAEMSNAARSFARSDASMRLAELIMQTSERH